MQYDWNMGDAVRLKVKCTWLVVFVSLEDSSVGRDLGFLPWSLLQFEC